MPHYFVAWAAFNAAQAAMLWPLTWLMLVPHAHALLQPAPTLEPAALASAKPPAKPPAIPPAKPGSAKSPPKLTLVASNAHPRRRTIAGE